MINHLYSLLLNSRKPSSVPAPPWQRYMDEEYVPKQLPPWLEAVRKALVPYTSWWDKVYRVEAIISVMLEPRYKEDTLSVDSRITAPDVKPFLFNFTDTVEGINAAASSDRAYVLKKASTFTPSIRRMWTITFPGDDTAVVVTDAERRIYEYTNNGIYIDPDIGIQVEAPTAGSKWRMISYTQPKGSLVSAFAAASAISDVNIVKLFSADTQAEQLQLAKYQRWYTTASYESDKLAAIALAYMIHASSY